jgi:hypothetical protein
LQRFVRVLCEVEEPSPGDGAAKALRSSVIGMVGGKHVDGVFYRAVAAIANFCRRQDSHRVSPLSSNPYPIDDIVGLARNAK